MLHRSVHGCVAHTSLVPQLVQHALLHWQGYLSLHLRWMLLAEVPGVLCHQMRRFALLYPQDDHVGLRAQSALLSWWLDRAAQLGVTFRTSTSGESHPDLQQRLDALQTLQMTKQLAACCSRLREHGLQNAVLPRTWGLKQNI